MGAIRNGWELAKSTGGVVKKNTRLALFPILSGIAIAVLFVMTFFTSLVGISAAGLEGETAQYAFIATYIVFYLASTFIVVFFNVCVIHCATLYFEKGEFRMGQGLGFAFKHLGAIFKWAMIAGTVGLLFKFLEYASRNIDNNAVRIITRIFLSITQGIWLWLTYFVVPVMVYQNIGVKQGITESKRLVFENWGEKFVGGAGLSIIFFIFLILGVIPLAIVTFLAFGVSPIIGLVMLGVTVLYIVALYLWYVTSITVLSSALYRYATTGSIGGGISTDFLRPTWKA